jgi:MFS transporter, FSR family, fosmidomycin resistance protein
VRFPWETQPMLLVALTLATVLGKAIGGMLADRCGWLPVGVGSMLAALPFLALASTNPVAAIPGMLLLNLTMPITLAAVAETVPDYPGFAFGLTCMALLVGALPSLLGMSTNGPVFVSLVLIVSIAVLHRGLRSLSFDRPFNKAVKA